MNKIIDIHHHIIPDFYINTMEKSGRRKVHGLNYPKWEPAVSLKMMNKLGIGKTYLSVTTPGVFIGSQQKTRDLARRCNDFLAKTVSEHPDRFGAFAALPMPYPEATLEEMDYALNVLNFDGVSMLSNVDGIYPNDARYLDLFQQLNERKSVVFLHPHDPPSSGYEGLVNVFFGWFMDTSTAVVKMEQAGIFDRFPSISYILAHGGGVLPAIDYIFTIRQAGRASLTADTAKVATPDSLPIIEKILGKDRILFGSDFPWATTVKSKIWLSRITKFFEKDPVGLTRVLHDNAGSILGKLPAGKIEEVNK